MILSVDSRGRITFPKELMKKMGWKVGDTLSFKYYNGVIMISKVSSKKTLNRAQVPLVSEDS